MKTAAVYIRVSSDQQLGNSPESQLAEIHRFAKANDYLILDEYIFAEEEGQSAWNRDKRPEFQRMIGFTKLKEKPFDAILVWKFSRFARSREDSVVYKKRIRERGIDVISVGEKLGSEQSAMSDMMEAIIECMDEYYSINLSQEVKRGHRNKIAKGEPVNKPPLGYKMENKRFVIDNSVNFNNSMTNAEIIKFIFSRFSEGASFFSIAKELNNLGLVAPSGGKFGKEIVSYILKNQAYFGKIKCLQENNCRSGQESKYIFFDGQYEPLVPPETFTDVQERLNEISRTYSYKAKSSPAKHLLQGLVRCNNCGNVLVGDSTRRCHIYQCRGYSSATCNVSNSIIKERLEQKVFFALEKILDTENTENITLDLEKNNYTFKSSSTTFSEKEVLQKQITKKENIIERLTDAYLNGVFTVEEFKTRSEKEKLELADLKEKLSNATTSDLNATTLERKNFILEHKDNILNAFTDENIPVSEKNKALRSFISKIIFIRTKDPQNKYKTLSEEFKIFFH